MFDFCDVTGTGWYRRMSPRLNARFLVGRQDGVLGRQRYPPKRGVQREDGTDFAAKLAIEQPSWLRGHSAASGSSCRAADRAIVGGSALNPIPRARTQCCSSSATLCCQEAARTIASFGNQIMRADTVDEPSREAQSASWHVGVGAA